MYPESTGIGVPSPPKFIMLQGGMGIVKLRQHSGTTDLSGVMGRQLTIGGPFLISELGITAQPNGTLITNTFSSNMAGGIWLIFKCHGRGVGSSFFREISLQTQILQGPSKITREGLTVRGELMED